MGVTLVGDGFRIEQSDFSELGLDRKALPPVVRPYRSGKELTQAAKERWVIDFFESKEADVRKHFPSLYQRLLETVRPLREENKRDAYRRLWFVFGEPRGKMRRALTGIVRFVATLETSKHRVFQFLPGDTLPDHSLFAVTLEDAFFMGVLSSRIHNVWALAAGSTLEDRPRWRNNTCFDPFAFPTCTETEKNGIRALAEELDAHRKRQQAARPDLTITGMYNVLEKLRSGEALTAKDKVIHEQGLVSVLKKLHDDLDAAVFDAYGWPHDLTGEQILERLVALNTERAAEERRGLIRWLRPDFQNPTGATAATQEKLAATDEPEGTAAQLATTTALWPKKLPEQIAAIRDIVTKTQTEWTIEQVASAFKGAKRADVEDVLDSLAALGILAGYESNGARRWKSTRAAA
jgi:hypothetical protein